MHAVKDEEEALVSSVRAPRASQSQKQPEWVRPVETLTSERRRRRGLGAVVAVLASGAALGLVLLAVEPTARNVDGRNGGRTVEPTELFSQMPIPDAFDVRWGYAECRGFAPITRMGGWGSACEPSYAMLVSAMLSARACRSTKGTLNPLLSPQSIMDCYQGGDGCADGTVDLALTTLESKPAVDVICMPLEERPGLGYVALPGKCETDFCHGATGFLLKAGSRGVAKAQFSSDSRVVSGETSQSWVYKSGLETAVPQSVEALQRAVLSGGPALGKINYYKSSGVGIRTDGLSDPISTFDNRIPALYYGPGPVADDEKPDAVHDVLVLGWSRNSDGEPYWLVMDTIGECYGDRGVFKIAMGANAGNFEGYGFTYADLDVERAIQDIATATFLGGCKRDLETKGDCKHAGILSPNGCQCKCPAKWAGERCETCGLQCKNGGIINNFNVESGGRSVETCRCDCPAGFAGLECEQACPTASNY